MPGIELVADLIISDFAESPDEVSSVLGACPTHVVREGHPTRYGLGKTNRWSLQSQRRSDRALSELIEEVLAQLRPRWPELVRLCARSHVELACDISREDGPDTESSQAIHITSEQVRLLGELGASIGFDVYL